MKFNKKLDIDDYSSRNGQNIKYIVLHDTGNKTDSDEGNLNYFNNGQRYASAHYFVDDDSYSQLVEEWNSAWHVGDGYGKFGITNENSIGIEMCRVNNTVTPSTEENTIWLVKKLMQKYAIPIDRVVRHYDASKKNCPSSFSNNNWSRWNSFKNKLVEKKEDLDVVIIGKEQNFKRNDERVKGQYCYAAIQQYVYVNDADRAKGYGRDGYILKGKNNLEILPGQKLKMYKAIDENKIECYPEGLGIDPLYSGVVVYKERVAIPKMLGDSPVKVVEKIVEVEKPLNLTKEICLEYLEKNLK